MSATGLQGNSNRQQRDGLKNRRRATGMANATVRINGANGFGIAAACALGIRLVLMLVVPEMLRSRASFVLAIAGHCSPTQLHRQKNHEKNEEPATHCGESVAATELRS